MGYFSGNSPHRQPLASTYTITSSWWKKGEDGSFSMKVEIPFGSTGEIRIPLEELGLTVSKILVNGVTLYQNGKKEAGEGCRLRAADERQVLVDTDSGSYEFVCC